MKKLAGRITAEQLYQRRGDGVRRELVRGEVREMTPAGGEHGSTTGKLHILLGRFVLEKRLGRLFAAETGFLIERNPDSVRAPDCAFVRAERLPGAVPKKYLPFPPDLAVETVSPEDRPVDMEDKVSQWLQSGVRLVWVLDPGRQTVTIHRPGSAPRFLTKGQFLEGEDVVPGFHLPVDDLWT